LIVSLQDGGSTVDGVMMDNDNDDNDDDDEVDENNHDHVATNFHREKSGDPNTIHEIFDIHANTMPSTMTSMDRSTRRSGR